ncbi:BglG family transcription antiterminator [Enterococcus faecium]|uniref:BglG family transcription antiterminator n=1 Tax=Enterococcus faecium TaxID=1352 RepID=UPI0002AF2D08|nr:helix-turn-helix domain-containing protein [Enterococcus faecium]ERK34047.1 hypothetical protein I131_08465 [Enterococcus faecium CRL1879]AGE30148.1 Transcriptional antiterminator of lichenan operon, BglG family [Enterococcus faecium ATCC 8459 = NRRL B-2354]EHU5001033.1 helix-turn-helix domain-containing protein [Enterococcus faecium]EOH68554.1 hypothetical protein UAG_01686 [Enterococcus faecium ATCC 8459 = NRRL B-2354]EOU03486.1 hypothetical protein I581_01906 [Enterococcus faecium ATCC 8
MNTRQKKLVELLLENKGKYKIIQYYQNKLLCSEKTVRSDLKLIQEFITENHIDALLKKIPGKGVCLRVSDEEEEHIAYLLDIYRLQIDSRYSLFRNSFYILLSRSKPISIPDLAEYTFSNSTTLKHEIKHWETLLNKFSLKLEKKRGLKIIGEEKCIRLFALYYFFGFSNNAFSYEITKISQTQINKQHKIFVNHLTRAMGVDLTLNAFLHFVMYLKIMIERLNAGFTIMQTPVTNSQQTNDIFKIQQLFLEYYDLNIPQGECLFLLDLIQISTKQYSVEQIKKFKPTLAVENAVKIFIRSIRDIINCSVDELTIKALQIEFDLAITRSTKKIRVINTLYNKIIQKDPFLLGIASYIFQSTPLLKKLNFNRMDISRIVMIIKNSIDEFYLEYPKVRASLVSNAGLDQLFYAKQTIEKYLPFIKIQDFLSPEKLDKEKICSDVVISFEYLNTVNYPIVYTDYLLTYDKLMMMKQKIKNLLFVKKNFRQTSYKSVSLNTNNTYYLKDLKNFLIQYSYKRNYKINPLTIRNTVERSSFVIDDTLYIILLSEVTREGEKVTFHLKKQLIIGMDKVLKVIVFMSNTSNIPDFYGRPEILFNNQKML